MYGKVIPSKVDASKEEAKLKKLQTQNVTFLPPAYLKAIKVYLAQGIEDSDSENSIEKTVNDIVLPANFGVVVNIGIDKWSLLKDIESPLKKLKPNDFCRWNLDHNKLFNALVKNNILTEDGFKCALIEEEADFFKYNISLKDFLVKEIRSHLSGQNLADTIDDIKEFIFNKIITNRKQKKPTMFYLTHSVEESFYKPPGAKRRRKKTTNVITCVDHIEFISEYEYLNQNEDSD